MLARAWLRRCRNKKKAAQAAFRNFMNVQVIRIFRGWRRFGPVT